MLLFSFTANDNDLQMEEGMSFTIGLCVLIIVLDDRPIECY